MPLDYYPEKISRSQIKPPRNRKSEVLAFFINSPKKPYSYLDVSVALNQNNAHRYIQKLEDSGVVFVEKTNKFKNRFGRVSFYKTFKLKTKKNAKSIYKLINK